MAKKKKSKNTKSNNPKSVPKKQPKKVEKIEESKKLEEEKVIETEEVVEDTPTEPVEEKVEVETPEVTEEASAEEETPEVEEEPEATPEEIPEEVPEEPEEVPTEEEPIPEEVPFEPVVESIEPTIVEENTIQEAKTPEQIGAQSGIQPIAYSEGSSAPILNDIDAMLEKNRLEREAAIKAQHRKDLIRNIFIGLLTIIAIALLIIIIVFLVKRGRSLVKTTTTTTTTTTQDTRLVTVPRSSTTTQGVITVKPSTTTTEKVSTVLKSVPTTNPGKSEIVIYSRKTTTTSSGPKYEYDATYNSNIGIYHIEIYKNGSPMRPTINNPIIIKSAGTEIAATKTYSTSIAYEIAGRIKSCGTLQVYDPDDNKYHNLTPRNCEK